MEKRRILVVDDEYKLVEAIRAYLEHEGFEVVGCHNGQEALDVFYSRPFDAIILDLMLPDLSGQDICRRIRQKSMVPILMLTARSDEESILEGLGIGADDYMTKPFSPRQLVARIQALLRRQGGSPIEGAILDFGTLVINELKVEVKRAGEVIKLTPTEYKLLLLLARNKGQVFGREALLNAVLDDPYNSLDRVIDNHIKNLRQKLEVDPKNPKWIVTVHGMGYIFRGESS